ncbi:hypothetical protein TNCV_4738131 [Trichonephila clavipes]|nr:hypothetical protein TNCV_4738131 [Trichonephila clavipes]
MLTVFSDASGMFYIEFLTKGLTVTQNERLERNVFLLHHDYARPHCSAQTQDIMGKLKFTLVSQPVGTPWSWLEIYANLQSPKTPKSIRDKCRIDSSQTFLQPRFGTIELLVVPKIEGVVERLTFFNGCRSGSRAQRDMQRTRIFLDGMKKWIERLNKCIC